MKLALMRFKGYTWYVNPLSIEITNSRETDDIMPLYNIRSCVDKGINCRVIKGKGEIKGEDCLEKYGELYMLSKCSGEGILSLPGLYPFKAYFTSLTASADTTPDTLKYSFVFTEATADNEKKFKAKNHSVKRGETLFDIAYEYKIPVENLVRLNSFVRRPDELKAGEVIRLC